MGGRGFVICFKEDIEEAVSGGEAGFAHGRLLEILCRELEKESKEEEKEILLEVIDRLDMETVSIDFVAIRRLVEGEK